MTWIYCFIIGGLFCVIAQILIDKTSLTPARILVTYVCAGVFLSAIGIYEPLTKLAGCGATVPLTGFGHTLAQGVRDAVNQYGLLGVLIGGLKATAGGITASIVFSFIMSLLFSGKPENL